ncbi:MAG: four helix bundle protein [Chloroflexi bacterium]|nr:four helix bundle protein [Chloroflexota bacterium]MBI3167435.1 four helix bundle protein [Chloroflexota bacterium]
MKSYRDLLIWQKGIALVKKIYLETARFPDSERYGLTNQIRRAAVSVPSNIAEGQARQHSGEFRQFLFIALGSIAELETQILISQDLGFLSEEISTSLQADLLELQKMTRTLASRLSK